MTETTGIDVESGHDGVLRIRINRPDVGNSLSPNARDALASAFENANAEHGVRAVLLSAAGDRHFCAGAGLPAKSEDPLPPALTEKRPGDIGRMLAKGWQRLVASILDCDKPVIAAVNGAAVGAGASLVLACDLVVMSSAAELTEAFVHRGILPDAGAVHLLTRIVGLRKASELLMLGEAVDADTCARLGLANRVVAPDQVTGMAEDMATRLAAGPSVMLTLTKRLLAVSSESDRDRAFEQEAWAAELISHTSDLREGLRAFAERRPPSFRGC